MFCAILIYIHNDEFSIVKIHPFIINVFEYIV